MSQQSARMGTPQHQPISVVNLRLIQSGVVEASFDVDTGCGFIIQGFALLDEPGQAMRVVLPATQRLDRNGKKLYSQTIKVEPAIKTLIDQAAMDAYRSILAAQYASNLETEVGRA